MSFTKKDLYLEFLKETLRASLLDYFRRDAKPTLDQFVNSMAQDCKVIADKFTDKFTFLVKEEVKPSAPSKVPETFARPTPLTGLETQALDSTKKLEAIEKDLDREMEERNDAFGFLAES